MQVGSYKLIHRVGSGGMGTVFRAVDASGNPVALKMIGSRATIDATIHAGRGLNPAAALDLNQRMMFVREARLAMGLDHSNIVRVFDYGQHEGLLYIVMEYLVGRALDKVVPLHAAIPLLARIAMIRQLCEALDYAHCRGVIHRDVKPANCYLLQSGALKVLDFGIAARADQVPGEFKFVGTPSYMAPELSSASPRYTESVDIWAAGVTLYQLLTGRLPFTGPSFTEILRQIARQPFPPLPESFPHTQRLGRILDRALAKDPAMRYASALDFAHDLHGVEAIAEDTSAPSAESRPVESYGWWATTVARESPIASPLARAASEAISMIAGEIRVRRKDFMLRFAENDPRILRALLIGFLLAGSYAIFQVAGGEGHGTFALVLWQVFAFLSGLLVPALIAIEILLGALAFLEKLAGAPKCRRCKSFLRRRSGVTAFAHSKVAWTHASSDCLAALQENLWEDAPKLLSMHGELNAPDPDRKTPYPPLRLSLDFYACKTCNDEMAVLTTEDRIGSVWNARPEYKGAYKEMVSPSGRPSVFDRLAGVFRAMGRAAKLAAEPVSPVLACVLVLTGVLVGIDYYPQLAVVSGIRGYRPLITIQSDPPGQVFAITNLLSPWGFTTPHIFPWAYGSVHRVTCPDVLYLGGNIYRFQGIAPQPQSISAGRNTRDRTLSHDATIQVDVARDRLGRFTSQPVTSLYVIHYAVTGKYDFMAEARAEFKAKEAAKTPMASSGANAQSIVVTSDPPGLAVLVDGVRTVTPKTFHWQFGSYHLLTVAEGHQTLRHGNNSPPEQYAIGRWDYGSKVGSDSVRVNWSAVPFPLQYTARFERVTPPQ